MTTTLTIRLAEKNRRALKKVAGMAGLSESAYLRQLIERDLAKPTMAERTGHLAGSLSLPCVKSPGIVEHLRGQNWRS